MKNTKRVLPALLLSLFAGFTAPSASAAQFSNVYVFGDSLSDAGYYRNFLIGAGVPANLAAIMGSYTTNPGPIWAELVAEYYGVTATPSNVSGGNIYAQGGARITGSPGVSTPPGQAQRPISTQIDEFLAANNGVADSNALYAVWGGANDVFFNLGAFQAGAITSAQLQQNVLGAAGAEIAQVRRLMDAGARYVTVFALPNVGAAPAFATSPARDSITALAAGYNTTLFTGLAGQGLRVIPVDIFSLFNEILANPGSFGFTNTTGIACGAFPPVTTAATANSLFCYSGNLTAPGADQTYIFADGVHPTTAAHAIVAQFVENLIEGPTQYGLLAEAPLRTRASHIRGISDGLSTGRQADVGSFSAFFAADSGKFDVESGIGNSGLDSKTRSGTLGITARVSESVVMGLGFGSSRNEATFGKGAGNFETTEKTLSLFGSMKWGGFYGTAVVSIADLKFNNIQRHIELGPNNRMTTANAEGSNSSAQLIAGYDFALGRFMIGPVVGITTQNVDVNQFDEAGGGSSGLRILQQKRRSEVVSFGARASLNLGNWTPWARITADTERRDDVRFVSAIPLSMLSIGSTYDIPAYRSDNSYMTAGVGITGLITRNIGASLAYYNVSGRSGIKEDGIHGMLSIKF